MALELADFVISEVDIPSLTDEEIDELNLFTNARRAESEPDDPPQPDDVARRAYRNIPAFVVPREFVARDADGAIAATAEASWAHAEDNQHILNADIHVAARHRRRGLARTLLHRVVEVADDAGKTLIVWRTNDRVPAGEAFMRRIGAEQGLVGHTNRLLFSDVDRDQIRRWVEEGPRRAEGYELFTIDGSYPEELAEQLVDLENVMNTAPRDDLDMEDQTFTVAQLRELERSFFSQGGERWMLVARHEATGELVGWTEVGWLPHQPKTVWQWGTGVRPEHRGHALGKWLKATMLERIFEERPDVVEIRTHNADSNDPMLGINHAMGFKPFRVDIHWQVKVETVKEYLG